MNEGKQPNLEISAQEVMRAFQATEGSNQEARRLVKEGVFD